MNLLELSQLIESRYRSYLDTTFYFRDPELRESFRSALKGKGVARGPFLEATPAFRKGRTLEQLCADLNIARMDAGLLGALKAGRRLYSHQEKAIERLNAGRNVVVATGTGSGKTEAFLIPILLHLYQEHLKGALSSGVRALILYPMNALANDQRRRLREIAATLKSYSSPFCPTYGRYIGNTPDNERDRNPDRDASGQNRDAEPYRPYELVFREEMRRTPPHILLTNYSMLEYLLLRPDDTPLFDNGASRWWRYIVLDEAHQYRGAKGMEMAMLIRRLKQRLRDGGLKGPIQCIATSATLTSDERSYAATAEFASSLFDEPFEQDDVIFSEANPIEWKAKISLSHADYDSLESGPSELIYSHLSEDMRALNLLQLVAGQNEGPQEFTRLAEKVFADSTPANRVADLERLVRLMTIARDPISDSRMMQCRCHLFLRSLEGAFLAFGENKGIFLEREMSSPESRSFELALCKRCGQHYLVGRIEGVRLVEANRDPSDDDFGADYFIPVTDWNQAEDEEIPAANGNFNSWNLCTKCGMIAEGNQTPTCNHNATIGIKQVPSNKSHPDQLEKCWACGYNQPDPVRELLHGADGPHSVIATALYQHISERDPKERKILAFADSRQEAAFFALYLEQSYSDIFERNRILKAARNQQPFPTEGACLKDIVDWIYQRFEGDFRTAPADTSSQVRKNIWKAIYREVLTDERRFSLEGVGLVRWSVALPNSFPLPECLKLPPWSLTDEESRTLIEMLLLSLIPQGVMSLSPTADTTISWDDLNLQKRQRSTRCGPPGGNINITSWDGRTGRRWKLLDKILSVGNARLTENEKTHAIEAALHQVLARIEELDYGYLGDAERILLSNPLGYRLNTDCLRFHLTVAQAPMLKCNVCGEVAPYSLRGVCLSTKCPGSLEQVTGDAIVSNHYRRLYESELPGRLHAVEHTAQLNYRQAQEFQRRFVDGDLNVLSSSTTFELGVDLGDLDVVLLRNIPPEPSNYVQRIGRAGRKPGHIGYIVAYAKRSAHDLYHWRNPQRMLQGVVQPPALLLKNEKIIRRHMAAVVFSHFFRENKSRFGSMEALTGGMANSSVRADVYDYAHARLSSLGGILKQIIPFTMHNSMGIDDDTWLQQITGAESDLSKAELLLKEEYQSLQEYRIAERAKDTKDGDRNSDWARRRMEAIQRESVSEFLSRRAIIPKYGFPVDVVQLDVLNTDSGDIELQRDLSVAIAEFAPESQLVANKKLWRSHAIKRPRDRELEQWWYVSCPKHGTFRRVKFQPGQPAPRESLTCCSEMRIFKSYIDPKYGFSTDRNPPSLPKKRPEREFVTKPYFDRYLGSQPLEVDYGFAKITEVSPGTLVVLCEGFKSKGFAICKTCGAGFKSTPPVPHKTAYGNECKGQIERQISLGHEFQTDVLKLDFHSQVGSGADPTILAWSLAYALLEGAAAVLEVPQTDLNVTIAGIPESAERLAPIILYDAVPGGAGLVAKLQDQQVLRTSLQSALDKLEKCVCGFNDSCYGCLRTYRNQFAHRILQRGCVIDFIRSILS